MLWFLQKIHSLSNIYHNTEERYQRHAALSHFPPLPWRRDRYEQTTRERIWVYEWILHGDIDQWEARWGGLKNESLEQILNDTRTLNNERLDCKVSLIHGSQLAFIQARQVLQAWQAKPARIARITNKLLINNELLIFNIVLN